MARELDTPVSVLDLPGEAAAALYDRKLVLSRPDQPVAWRGDALPDKPERLIERLRGAL